MIYPKNGLFDVNQQSLAHSRSIPK